MSKLSKFVVHEVDEHTYDRVEVDELYEGGLVIEGTNLKDEEGWHWLLICKQPQPLN